MLGSFPVAILAGTVLGFLSGLGIGGGSLLVLWMTLVVRFPEATARIINLLFFIPAAICACIFRWKQGNLPLKKIWLPMLLGCVTAGIFSFLGSVLETAVLRKIFGLLLIVTGLRELSYRPRKLR